MKKIIMLLTIMIVGLMLTVNASTKTIVTDGLVSFWSFDQGTVIRRTVKDVWGENDATTVGSPKRVDGYVGGGLKLNGNGDYVSLPNVGNFGSQIGEYTFEVWVKTTNKKKWSAIYKVLEKTCAIGNNGTGILINAMGGWRDEKNLILTELDWIMVERSRIRENGCGGSVFSGRNVPLSDGKWHQIVYTTRGATEEEVADFNRRVGRNLEPANCTKNAIYIDTKIIMIPLSCSFEDNIIAYVEPIFLGAVNNQDKASGFFNGVFDEVRIYDRALTHEEVIHNYESDIGLGVDAVEKLPTVWGVLKERR